jgi:hypothetical protein
VLGYYLQSFTVPSLGGLATRCAAWPGGKSGSDQPLPHGDDLHLITVHAFHQPNHTASALDFLAFSVFHGFTFPLLVCMIRAMLEHWPLTLPILLRFQNAMQVLE